MGLTDRAIADVKRFTTDSNGWGVSALFTAPNNQTATVNVHHVKHNLGVDTDGNMVNSKKAHVSFSESGLLEINPNYPLRDSKQEINMKGHRIDVADSTGITKNYIVKSTYPDEKIGLIVVILDDYE